jgi:hypothetical protein
VVSISSALVRTESDFEDEAMTMERKWQIFRQSSDIKGYVLRPPCVQQHACT